MDGNLERAIRSLGNGETTFKARWRACGANLRAGRARVVVAADNAPPDLVRILRFVNDHSDLDVRLVTVQKFEEPSGVIYVPNWLVLGAPGSVSIRSTVGENGTNKQVTSALQAVVDAYEALPEPKLPPLKSGSANYRKLRPEGWPYAVHYEFLHRFKRISCDLHLESAEAAELAPVLKALAEELSPQFGNGTLEWDPNWNAGNGRLRLLLPDDAQPSEHALAMAKLISLMRQPVTSELGKLTNGTVAGTS